MKKTFDISLFSKEDEVVIFGTGEIGLGKGRNHINALGFSVNYYCDNDSSKWGKAIIDGIVCISPSELEKHPDAIVFILTNPKNSESIKRQLLEMGIRKIITFQDIEYCDEYVDAILKLKEPMGIIASSSDSTPYYCGEPIKNKFHKRIALYTCITGGYDCLLNPQVIETDKVDYYFLSENKPIEETVYNYIDIKSIVPDSVKDNIRKNRFCKILGCELFSEYDYSIYVDGSYLIKREMSHYIDKIGKAGIALRRETETFDCIYQQAAWAMEKFSDEEVLRNQMKRYYSEGMPRHWGSYACPCLVRDNKNEKLKKVMRDWWNEVYTGFFRDQTSFTYAFWKNGFTQSDIGVIEGEYYDNAEMELVNTHGH